MHPVFDEFGFVGSRIPFFPRPTSLFLPLFFTQSVLQKNLPDEVAYVVSLRISGSMPPVVHLISWTSFLLTVLYFFSNSCSPFFFQFRVTDEELCIVRATQVTGRLGDSIIRRAPLGSAPLFFLEV